MRLSTKGRYAVMAMVDLTRHSGASGERPVALADIAERQQISLSYLEQLFARLRRGGLVASVRGPGGGYLPGAAPSEIRIADIIQAVDDASNGEGCTPDRPADCGAEAVATCPTHHLWAELSRQLHLYLAHVSLGDVVDGRLALAVPPTTTRPAADLPTRIAAE